MALPRISGEFRVGSDPTLRFSEAGKPFGNFRAVASARKEVNGEWTTTDEIWLTVTVFGKTAEMVADSVAKGDLVYVDGRVADDKYTTKEGVERSNTKVMADVVALIPKAPTTKQAAPQANDNPWDSGNQSTAPDF